MGTRAAEPDVAQHERWGMPRVLAQALIEVCALLGVYLREELFPAEGKLLCLPPWPQKVVAFSQSGFLLLQGKELSKPMRYSVKDGSSLRG